MSTCTSADSAILRLDSCLVIVAVGVERYGATVSLVELPAMEATATYGSRPEEEIVARLRGSVEGKGLEVHPFNVGSYNARVSQHFLLPHHDDTLAVVVISTPAMFEKLFLPWLEVHNHPLPGQDPMDQCLREEMANMASLFPGSSVEVVQDWELLPSRRPKILVQTAGHMAGAAYFYQRTDVTPQPWDEKSKIFGVSVHPKYGGWFALRGVLLFHGLLAVGLSSTEPPDCVPSREMRIKLLEKFNFSWRDWSYRDVCSNVVEKYSEKQKIYFSTEPKDRFTLIEKWKNNNKHESESESTPHQSP